MHYSDADKLRFMGRMNAYISHELKNILATISETAGLMGDLIELSGSGRPLDTERIAELCTRIASLVTRGNETVRNMNGLAHSMDEDVRDSDAGTEAALMAGLSQYAPRSKAIDLDIEGEAPLRTRSFEIQHLLAELLLAAFAALETGQRLPMRVTDEKDGAAITLEDQGALDPDSSDLALARAILDTLQGCNLERDGDALRLTLKNEE